MEVLSSRWTLFLKRMFPVIWFGFVLVASGMAWPERMWERDPLFFVGPALMTAIGIVLFRKVWNLVDEVRDGGNVLIVRKGSLEERIPLADIVNINASQFTNPQRVSLRMRTRGKLGDEIDFLPRQRPLRFNPFARNEIAESLIKRVDAARQGAPR